ARIAPDGWLVTERCLKDAALAVSPCPGERPAVKARPHRAEAQIDRCRVEAQEHMRSAIVEIADLIDLVIDGEGFAEKDDERACAIGDIDRYALMTGMVVEIAADEIEVLGPSIKCIGRGMKADEAMARADEIEKGAFLRVTHRQIAGRVKDDGRIRPQLLG